MASTNLYLDKRRAKKDGTYPLRININKDGKNSYISLNISLLPEHWDAKASKVVGRTDKSYYDTLIHGYKQQIDNCILDILHNRKIRNLTADQLKRMVVSELFPESGKKVDTNSFSYVYGQFTERHDTKRTKEIYKATYVHLQKYLGDNLERLYFEDISKEWLEDFDRYLMQTVPSKNARNIHIRNIRAVFNYAIDKNITTNYPFRQFSIKNVATPKRSLTLEQLRTLFNYPCEDWQQQYVDMFKLSFFLCGINVIDLFNLNKISNDGRIEYYRAKTHKFYSIKVEPEAMEIINKYRGEKNLLNMADRYKNYKDYAQRLNNTVMHIGEYKRVGRGGKKVYTPLFPDITTYWMRHTWASIAAELDIPDDTISRALGHSITSGARVTQVYINFNNKKIDEANRRVLDYVLYNEKWYYVQKKPNE